MGRTYVPGGFDLGSLAIDGTEVTSTGAELNILDGVTATTAELNILDGVTSTTAELNILDGVTSTTAELNILDGVTAATAEVNVLDVSAQTAMTPGTGISTGTGTLCKYNVSRIGSLYRTTIVIDLTGLRSTAADDIIGVDGTALYCHIGQITAAVNGTIFAGSITCLEAPAGGDPDIDLYSATEGTGTEDDAISGLTETQLINAGDHAANAFKSLTAYPAADEYLYLVAGDTTDADYTAGILVIELFGS